MTPEEAQTLRSMRAILIQQVAAIDTLLNVQSASKNSPEASAQLGLDTEAYRIIGYWETACGVKPPHDLVCSWLKEYGWKEVATVANQMFAKHKKETMDDHHQTAYVSKVLKARVAPTFVKGAIEI